VRTERFDGSEERSVVTAMITSKEVLAKIAPCWKDSPMASTWANLVGKWCVEYYRKYSDAPQRNIEGLFASWASKRKGDDTVNVVERFLTSLSEDYEASKSSVNAPLVIDTASKHFRRVALSKLAEELQRDVDAEMLDDAEERLRAYSRIDLAKELGVDVLDDEEGLREALDPKENEPLIEFSGTKLESLGRFYGANLGRDCFVAFMAPEKRGKSWLLFDLAWRAMEQRRRVALFEVGDMSKKQVYRRLAVRAAKAPAKGKTLRYPIYLEGKGDEYEINFKDKHFKKDLDWRDAWKAFQEVKKVAKTKKSYLKLCVHPAGSVGVEQIKSAVLDWEREGWSPDVICIDYADLLHCPLKTDSEREKINHVWTSLRALSQERHCLVVTATQASRASYKARWISMEHSSEDKRKLAHVTGMVGINQTAEEKRDGVIRLGWVVLREEEFHMQWGPYVAQCLALGDPCVRAS
jgi:replicative DNA helicase